MIRQAMTNIIDNNSNPYQSPASLTNDFGCGVGNGCDDELIILDNNAKIRDLEEHIKVLIYQLNDKDMATLLLFLGITMISFFVGYNLARY